MQIIKGIAIAAVLIIAGLLALIVTAYLAFRIAAAIFEQQESWKDSGSRKDRKHDLDWTTKAGIKRHYLAGLHTEQGLCRNCNICIMCQTAANVMQQQRWRLRGRA